MNTPTQRIAIGADDAGFALKGVIAEHLRRSGLEVEDFGVHNTDPSLYPDIALDVAQAVADGKYPRGILICGTGIGVCITANKVPGIRAAVCHDSYSAERARRSNDCQIMTLGSRVVGEELAKQLVDIWLKADFDSNRSGKKVDRINAIEKDLHA
jgi:ribose 5-phosphate isomerase B